MLVSSLRRKTGTCVPGDRARACELSDQPPGFGIFGGTGAGHPFCSPHRQGVASGLHRVYLSLGRGRENGCSPHSCILHQSGEMGNFSLAVLTCCSPFPSCVSAQRPSALFWECPLSRADQKDPQTIPIQICPQIIAITHHSIPTPQRPVIAPAQLCFVSQETNRYSSLWLGISLGEINPQKGSPRVFFLLCET